MNEQLEDVKIIESTGIDVFEAQERASIDTQIATAKRFPRNLRKVLDNSIAIVTMDIDTAKTCRYTKPVGGKQITGASVHLARIICQQYGNIRVQQRIKSIDAKTIVAEAVAFDMETNYAVCVEARRSILKKDGTRYDESTIETNAMAIMAIAERNAILKILPKVIVDKTYNEAFAFAFGNLTDKAKLLKERNRIFSVFKDKYNLQESDVLKVIGLGTKEAVGPEDIANLSGIIQSLVDKEIQVSDLLEKVEKKTGADRKADLKGKQTAQQTEMQMP